MSGKKTSRAFIDSNVLIYSADISSPIKHATAKSLMNLLWESGQGCISLQVLQEFYVNVTRKIAKPISPSDAYSFIYDLAHWPIHSPTASSLLSAIERQQRLQISFWDAMIVSSAIEMDCSILWSEDLNNGQSYDGVIVRNPFNLP